MSTSKKKTIKFTALMTVLILTVTYFSLLTPTSAYFYQEFPFENDGITFSLLEFGVSEENRIFEDDCNLKFKAATKLADDDEFLFDEVVITRYFEITNAENGVPAKVFPRIHLYDNAEDKGLRYMVFVSKTPFDDVVPAESVSEESETEEITDGPIKSAIKEKNSSAAYENKDPNAPENNIVELAPGEKAFVKIYFWAEYDKVMSSVEGKDETERHSIWQDASAIATVGYKCNIEFIASQLSPIKKDYGDEPVTEAGDEPVTEALTLEAPTWKEKTSADNQ